MPSFRYSSLVLAPASTCCSAAISVLPCVPCGPSPSPSSREARGLNGLRLLQFPSDQFLSFASISTSLQASACADEYFDEKLCFAEPETFVPTSISADQLAANRANGRG